MIKMAFYNLFRRKSRTFLSVFMIAVGVLSIIALVSIVDGLFADVQGAVGQLQGIMVFQKGGMGPMYSQLDEDYRGKLESVYGVKKAEPVIMSLAKSVEGKGSGFDYMNMVRLIGTDFSQETTGQSVSGVTGEIVAGRHIKPGEKGKVIIGTEIQDKYNKFPGNSIKINGEKFQVIGVYKTGSKTSNSAILMNIDDLRELIGFPAKKVAYFSVSLENPEEIDKVAKLLKFKYGEKLQIANTAQFSESIASAIGDIRSMVFAVAAIAAIVAGVGIINTMLMSIMERFKEIGALKATGWTNSNIMVMILYESAFIGIIGGVLGCLLGIAASIPLSQASGFDILVSPELLLESFTFAVCIGIAAGLYPAWKASKFDPVQALAME
ncbi:MAG: ABC transporter permease [Candidatus Diapherotrites archaeon]|nr:ABC transporter permease [Candidatus Diapherotrites archaeon]